jgi:hypothetical protein
MPEGSQNAPRTKRNNTAAPRGKNVVMASHGRAPWYGPDGKNVEAYVIGIAGGSASGKVRPVRQRELCIADCRVDICS